MKNEYRVGLFFMIGILVLVFVMDFLGDIPFFSNNRNVYTYFDSLGELRKGNPVKLEGLVIGRVSDIRLEDRKLKVEMEIKQDAPVKNDSVASIQLTSLLGTSYVNVTFGSAESAENFGKYPLPSIEPTDLNKILAKLDSALAARANRVKHDLRPAIRRPRAGTAVQRRPDDHGQQPRQS